MQQVRARPGVSLTHSVAAIRLTEGVTIEPRYPTLTHEVRG